MVDALSPDWLALEARYGGNLLHRGSLDQVASHCGAGVVMIATLPGGSPALLADLTRGFVQRGVCAIAPELMIAQMSAAAFLGHPHSNDWARWCVGIRSMCSAVVVAPEPGVVTSGGVWRDVCAALSVNVPVWILEG